MYVKTTPSKECEHYRWRMPFAWALGYPITVFILWLSYRLIHDLAVQWDDHEWEKDITEFSGLIQHWAILGWLWSLLYCTLLEAIWRLRYFRHERLRNYLFAAKEDRWNNLFFYAGIAFYIAAITTI